MWWLASGVGIHIIADQVGHFTHRCYKKQRLYKIAKDRRRWL